MGSWGRGAVRAARRGREVGGDPGADRVGPVSAALRRRVCDRACGSHRVRPAAGDRARVWPAGGAEPSKCRRRLGPAARWRDEVGRDGAAPVGGAARGAGARSSVIRRSATTRSPSSTASRRRPSPGRSWTSPRSCRPTTCGGRSSAPSSSSSSTSPRLTPDARGPPATARAAASCSTSSPTCRTTAQRTRSDVEAAFLQLCLDHDLPRPQINRINNGAERDFRLPAHRLIVEVDGYAYHRDRRAFTNDRARDREALRRGHRTARFTATEIVSRPTAVAHELRALLNLN